jgi:hypothetical protein
MVLSIIMMMPLAGSGALPDPPPGFTEAKTGFCRITLPRRNIKLIAELDDICTDGIREIFGQLGHKVGGETPPILVRIVSRPDEMVELAPKESPPPEWSGAVAYPDENLIIVPLRNRFGSPNSDLTRIMAHELSHLALRQSIKGAEVPRWFSEGIAIHQSETSSIKRHFLVWLAARRDGLLGLGELEHYPEDVGEIDLAYAEAADFVGFLIEKEGWLGIRTVIRRLAEGAPFGEAVSYAFAHSLAGLELEWRSGLTSNWQWIPILTGTSAVWGFIVTLFIIAYMSVRKRRRRRLKEMAAEEEALDNVIHAIDEMARQRLPSRPKTTSNAAVPTSIRVDDEIHTLH